MRTDTEVSYKALDTRLIPWAKWKEEWKQADNVAKAVGLLHTIFQTDTSAEVGGGSVPICFLLKVADGHLTLKNATRAMPEFVVAEKAFKMLAQEVFKHDPEIFFRNNDLETVKALQWFMRPKEGTGVLGRGFYNIDLREKVDHSTEVAREFVKKFLSRIWRGNYYSFEGRHRISEKMTEYLEDARPWVIETWHYGNRSTLLELLPKNDAAAKAEWSYFDGACLEKLKELALKGLYHGDPQTIEYAVLQGSAAAYLYVLASLAREQQERVDKELRLKRTIEQSKSELAELNGGKA